MVGEGVPVAVGEVREAARHAVLVGGVPDERDRVDVGAERRAGQRQATVRRVERLAHRVAPRHRVARVVDLVEDHQRLEALGADPQRQRVGCDAGVGHRDAEVVLRRPSLPAGVRRVERDPRLARGLGPLRLEVLGGCDDGDPLDPALREQLGGDRQRERRLAGAGRRDREVVTGRGGEVPGDRLGLPGAQLGSGAPGGTVGISGREGGRMTLGGGGHLTPCLRRAGSPTPPCTPGRPGTSPGPGWAPRPSRRGPPPGCP